MCQEKRVPWRFLFWFGFNWGAVALQGCVGFCWATAWVHCTQTFVPWISVLPPLIPTSRSSRSSELSSRGYTVASHWPSLSYTWRCISVCPVKVLEQRDDRSVTRVKRTLAVSGCEWPADGKGTEWNQWDGVGAVMSSRGESCWGKDFSVGPLTTGCITEQNAGSILKKCTGYAKFRKSKLSIHVTPLTGR